MSNALTAWPDERTESLKRLWAEGDKSASVIGAELGVSRNAVLGKVFRLGLPQRENRNAAFYGAESKPRVVYVKPVYLRATLDIHGAPLCSIAKPLRVKRTRAHEGMKTVPMRETERILREPTKNQLRAMLAEAVRNTAAMATGAA